ncbi:hypothetical protein TNCV_17681 [Trichonephila clavipes]|nr:hypothetical protein TNCV_17681 [Trichonephila clavipes]
MYIYNRERSRRYPSVSVCSYSQSAKPVSLTTMKVLIAVTFACALAMSSGAYLPTTYLGGYGYPYALATAPALSYAAVPAALPAALPVAIAAPAAPIAAPAAAGYYAPAQDYLKVKASRI